MLHWFEKIYGLNRRLTLLVLDSALLLMSWQLTSHIFNLNQWPYLGLGAIITIKLLIFYKFKLYEFMWRYASIHALLNIFFAVTVGSIALLLLSLGLSTKPPLLFFLVDWAFTLIAIGGLRFNIRLLREYLISKAQKSNEGSAKKVIIIGAGDAGEIVAREIKKSMGAMYAPIGFVDDKPSKLGKVIHHIPVLGKIENLEALCQKHDIQEALIAIPSASGNEVRRIVELCKKAKVTFKITPSLVELIDGNVSLAQLRDVQIEDLLGRKVVETDLDEIQEFAGKTVLVTGAGGSIGSELARQITSFNPKTLIIVDNGEFATYEIDYELRALIGTTKKDAPLIISVVADVKNKHRLNVVFDQYRPHIVFHAAAYKHVPLMEKNITEVVSNNILGTRNMIELSDQYQAEKFILISTDKAVYPANAMGASKRICELLMQIQAKTSTTTFGAVRFGNVLGSKGSVVPLFKKQIKQGGPITVTHPEMTRYFMTIPEAVRLVIQAGFMAKGGDIFILDMGEPVKIYNLAKDMIQLSGLQEGVDIEIQFTGLRLGEKLAEELFFDKEHLIKTPNSKILITKPFQYDVTIIKEKIDALITHIDERDEAQTFQDILEIIHQTQPPQ
jgi:FlaA1/EpsC-like NDP-sugar epimerase